jgi:hypothetical protein
MQQRVMKELFCTIFISEKVESLKKLQSKGSHVVRNQKRLIFLLKILQFEITCQIYTRN